MAGNLYWISTVTYAFVLLAILVNEIRKRKIKSELDRAFLIMISWVIFFCIQDSVWGICESGILKGDRVFFAASSIFHVSTVFTTFFWLYYVLLYIGEQRKRQIIYLVLDGFVILFEIVLVVMNYFTNVLFTIENGTYYTGLLRPITFINQYIIYLIIGIIAFIFGIKKNKERAGKRYFSVAIFALAPILLGFFQLLYPDGPFYSLGYFLGCFIVHLFLISKDWEAASKMRVLKSLADTYYSMHLVDIETDKCEVLIESETLAKLMKNEPSAQERLNKAFKGTVSEEYLEMVLEFVNLSDISERMKDTNHISCEFIGRNFGWTRVSFVSVEKTGSLQKKVMVTTRVIDEEKRKQIDLIFKSNNDELTSLYNRRAFETDLHKYDESELPDNIAFVSIDVNGLKVVNDSLGHDAGDDLLVGGAECMKRVFGLYGKIYRTGGDEFCAIIFADCNQIEAIKRDFEERVTGWKGKKGQVLSVSCGYVLKSDVDNPTLQDMSKLADERMYEAKTRYYMQQGLDRRGQRDAHLALFSLYTKILKINLCDDSYQIIRMSDDEKNEEMGFSEKLSEWFRNFGLRGNVHPDDLEHYLEQTDINYLRSYFNDSKTSLSIFYRRLIGGEYKQVMVEIVPSGDYSKDNQSMYVYVKKIDR